MGAACSSIALLRPPRLAARDVPERAARRPGPRSRHPEGGLGQSGRLERRPAARLAGRRARAAPATSPRARSRPASGMAIGGRPGAFALGVAAVVGHTFPLYRKGGKGVATGGRRARRAVPADRRRPRGRVVRRRAACCTRRRSRRCSCTVLFPVAVVALRLRHVGDRRSSPRSRYWSSSATSVTFDGCCGARRTISAHVRADERRASTRP